MKGDNFMSYQPPNNEPWQPQEGYNQPPNTNYPPQYQTGGLPLPPNQLYPQQPPMYPPPSVTPPAKKKKRGPLFWIVVLIIVVVALAAIVNATSHVASTQSTWTTTHTFTGNGIEKTAIFTVSNDWKIIWSCNPASFYGSVYNVQVIAYNSDGSIADFALNALCKTDNISGETEEHQSGDVYLSINSESDWTIQIQELQ
jgi:uncharacterized protein (UPF0333 family)